MDNQEAAQPRRRLLRRSRGMGFASGSGSSGSDLRTPIEHDSVDDAIDPEDASNQIRGGLPAPIPDAAQQGMGPRDRLHQVNRAGSMRYAKEYRLTVLSRMLMQGIPLDQIASSLGVSISTVEKDRAELKKTYREYARSLDIDEMIGGQNAFYDEVQQQALRISGGSQTPTAMKLAAHRTALAANADRARFMQNAGVFDALRFRIADSGNNLSDIQMLMKATREALAGLNSDDGFDAMSFDKSGGESGDSEIQEL